ncbi:hypothetical protein [Caballeronia sp.]|uniref:hypothetical protein n=1 Tax=Caballeronia sp. TaxID=1931223 RepID=UPI003C3C5AD4
MNETAYWIICFMSWREQVYSRWLHAKHHTFTHLTDAPYKDLFTACLHRIDKKAIWTPL